MNHKTILAMFKNISAMIIFSISLCAIAEVKVDFDKLPYVERYWLLPAKEIDERANAGDPFAQKIVSSFYSFGIDAYPYDKKQADIWSEKATIGFQQLAEKGNPAAQYMLGIYYRQKESRDLNKAIAFYKLAAEKGDLKAQVDLGQIYRNIEEIRDLKLSEYWFQQALPELEKRVQQGDSFSISVLVHMYRNGYGGKPKDANQAQYWGNKVVEIKRQEMLTLNEHAFNPTTSLILISSYMTVIEEIAEGRRRNDLYLIKIYVLSDLLLERTRDPMLRKTAEQYQQIVLALSEMGEEKLKESLEYCRKTPSEVCY